MADQRRGHAQEQRRIVGHRKAALPCVFGVVEPEADDLARLLDDREELRFGQLLPCAGVAGPGQRRSDGFPRLRQEGDQRVGFRPERNRLVAIFNWFWNWIFKDRGARVLTGKVDEKTEQIVSLP